MDFFSAFNIVSITIKINLMYISYSIVNVIKQQMLGQQDSQSIKATAAKITTLVPSLQPT